MTDLPEVESGVPLPMESHGNTKYGFERLGVGQSLMWAHTPRRGEHPVYHAARMHGKKYKKRFRTERVDGGTRVWRVK